MTGTWFSTLLLSITGIVLVQANECVVGVVGERVVLPCVYHGVKNLTSLHISSEWRRGTEIMHSAVWTEGQMYKRNVSNSGRTAVSSFAPNTGDFSMELHDLVSSDTHNYSLKLHGQANISLVCTVCLTVEVDVQINTSVGRRSEHVWLLTVTLCVLTSLLVAISLGFQRKRERDRKRKQNKEDSSSQGTDMIEFDVEQLASHPETVV